MKIQSNYNKILSDLTTPVGLFLKVREHFAEAILLESSDYSSKENSMSFICFEPLLTLKASEQEVLCLNHLENTSSPKEGNLVDIIDEVMSSFQIDQEDEISDFAGMFGYTSYSAVPYFETLQFDPNKGKSDLPLVRYDYYRFLFVFNHFTEDLFIIENLPKGKKSKLEWITNLVLRNDYQTFGFTVRGEESENMSDNDFKNHVTEAKKWCKRGDVFQVVPSRQFSSTFKGDEFNVYRALRSINPSPYLFYFDYGSYKIFGSSPEAQLIVDNGIATVHPIAGTFRRSGDFEKDQEQAELLKNDPKESAEHMMLVDLARNDLSKNCKEVEVVKFKMTQFFSHVIHLSSVVSGEIKEGVSSYQIFADCFPAGTLSGAPKYRAMQIIDQMEPDKRTFYGGGIGMLKCNGDINHAIIIRSFLSQQGKLFYQAGAGIVIDSDENSELQEVNNKLAALRKAMTLAEKI